MLRTEGHIVGFHATFFVYRPRNSVKIFAVTKLCLRRLHRSLGTSLRIICHALVQVINCIESYGASKSLHQDRESSSWFLKLLFLWPEIHTVDQTGHVLQIDCRISVIELCVNARSSQTMVLDIGSNAEIGKSICPPDVS